MNQTTYFSLLFRFSSNNVAGRRYSNTEQLDDFDYTAPRYQRNSYAGPMHPPSNGHFDQDEMQYPRPQPLQPALGKEDSILVTGALEANQTRCANY